MKIPTFQEYSKYSWEKINPLYQELQDLELNEDNVNDWMSAWSELRKLVDERYARLSLATDLDTTDEKAEKAYHKFLEDVYPSTQSADQQLKEKLLQSGSEQRD